MCDWLAPRVGVPQIFWLQIKGTMQASDVCSKLLDTGVISTCVGLSLRLRCLTGWMGRRNGCPRREEGAEVERASEGAEIKFLGEPHYWFWVNGVLPSSGRSWRYPCITHSLPCLVDICFFSLVKWKRTLCL